MAVIGARPVSGIGILRPRVRSRPRPVSIGARSGALRRRRETSGIPGLLAVIAVAAGLALFYLSQSSHVAATGYEIDALQSQVDRLGREQQQLILRIGAARSPARIEAEARTQLHLSPLDNDAVSFAASAGVEDHATH